MPTFDFITDEHLRKSLDSDLLEIANCAEARAWKAVHVLAGGVIEAVLVDHLTATPHKTLSKGDILKMDLGKLIEACEKDKVLSAKTVALSAAVKEYRNLIHPGRALRLSETPDENGATVVRALLEMVVQEVSSRKKQEYGYTAEQLVSKLERDSSVMPILPHLLRDMRDTERKRFLLGVASKRYFELEPDDPFAEAEASAKRIRLAQCFRAAFDIADDETKQLAAKTFADFLRERSGDEILEYETAFFRASDLAYLDAKNRSMVKGHLLSRLKDGLSNPLIEALAGIEGHVERAEISELVDACIKAVFTEQAEYLKEKAKDFIYELWVRLPSVPSNSLDKTVVERLNQWIEFLGEQNREEDAATLIEIRDRCKDDVPF